MAKFSGTSARLNSIVLARLAAQVEGVSAKAIAQADTRAIVSVRRRFEPAAKKAVREVYNVRVGDLVGRYQIRSGADEGGEFLSLHASTRKLPLLDFGGRWGGRKTAGATAEIQAGTRKTYNSAFIATVNGQRRLLVRQFSRDSRAKSGRDPRNKLRVMTGPSAFQMVTGEGSAVAAGLARQMNEYRGSELVRQLQLARKRKR